VAIALPLVSLSNGAKALVLSTQYASQALTNKCLYSDPTANKRMLVSYAEKTVTLVAIV